MTPLKNILLAEDNARDVELTLEALSDNNLANHVVPVSDGVEVLEYLRCEGKFKDREKGNPAVILMDIKMPRLDGIETLRLIRSDPAFKTLPVVILSSSREEQDVMRSYNMGVNAYVVKPVSFKDFVEAVKIVGMFWALINEQPPQ
ncbi:MAG: two-component system response regulator [Elusimicrobia bacterium CG08_land_8_20_14_0_20_51_18]|nr:MAG: two-component system response regulator [Elusimicrobia bacterium CG08_land_8_20_14_0_20_51_18]